MANSIDRENVIKAYEDFINGYECFCTSDDYEYEMHKAVLALLKEQEAVVRCKDCAYLNRDPRFMNYGYCSYFKDEFYAKVKPDKNFYCGAGKRLVK